MAEGTGGVAAAGAAAAATGTATGTGAPAAGSQGNLSQAPGPGGAATQRAIDNATPTPGQTAGAPKTWDVKVDGHVVRMTEAEMISSASLGKAAFKRMEEANGLKGRVDSFWEAFQKDPMGALDNPAIKLTREQKRAAIEKYYKSQFIDQDSMTPEQKELAEAKKWRTDREAEDAKKEEGTKAEAKKVLEGQWRDHYSKVIIEALDKGGLPKSPKTVGRMALYLQQNAANKIDQTIEQVAARVKQDYQEEFSGLAADDSPVEALIEILGPNAVKKLQKYALEQHRKKLAGELPGAPAPTTRSEPKKKADEEPATGAGWKKTTQYWSRRDK